MNEPTWGPTGPAVFERTYSRPKPNGEREAWLETVERVVDGNLGLVDPRYREVGERDALIELFYTFKALPAGRHLWASGVPGRQYLFNCHVSGWGENFSDHAAFQLLRSAEGGGVGANYSSRYLRPYGPVRHALRVHVVCDPAHPDYEAMRRAGVLSEDYIAEWAGAFEIGDSREGWAEGLVDLLNTYMRQDEVKHVNRVYDVSNIRPEGARLKAFGGRASGPLPYARMLLKVGDIMNASRERAGVYEELPGSPKTYILPLEAMAIDHAIGEAIVAGGVRRTARMSIVHWKDPAIYEFINCKRDSGDHWTTNISVEIDDEFIDWLHANPFGVAGEIPAFQHAHDVMDAVARGMLHNGEPGFWNSTLSNKGEPNRVVCTNPCGEIALEEWENCNLGHINLDAFAGDLPGAVDAHRLMARFLIRATYGDVTDARQAGVLARNRRIGVGHFGFQGWLVKQGITYSSSPRSNFVRLALATLADEVRDAADQYAFQLRIPSPVKVTTIAPTGSIAKMPGRTEGIHPIYARYFNRRVRFSMIRPEERAQVEALAEQGYRVEDDIYDKSGNTRAVVFPTKEMLLQEVEDLGLSVDLVESSDEISLGNMLAVQAMYQEIYADNAVSFTVNIVPGEIADEYELGYELARMLPYLKGTTVFPDLSRPQAPYERITREEWEASVAQDVGDGVDEECSTGACPVR